MPHVAASLGPSSPPIRALLGLGVAVLALAASSIVWMDVRSLAQGGAPPDMTLRHVPLLLALRAAFLALAAGALLVVARGAPRGWHLTVLGASVVLVASVIGDLVGAASAFGMIPDPTGTLGPLDAVERRLFRLATMASRAVPLLALLAALEHTMEPAPLPSSSTGRSRVAEMLVRYEPVLFAIGASTLATILAGAAFLHKELTWALPIGADTTLAGCAAAAIRAHRRHDGLAFVAWLAVSTSMGAGLLMGTYSFGGPLPTPALVGPYDALTRMLLRDAHIVTIALGIAAIALAVVRRGFTRQAPA